MIQLVAGPIDAAAVIRQVQSPAAGAVVTFDGVVRNHARGKAVTHLFYEAYDDMALKEMDAIRTRSLEQFPVIEVAIAHRVGRLEIGESSVLVAVSSAHRKDAFEACRFAIDTLKKTVPIWKREHYEDGEVWVEEYAGG